MIPAGEPGHVGGVADDGGGDDRADPEDVGDRGARRADRDGQLVLRLADLGVQAAHVGQELGGELAAGLPGGAGRLG